MKEYHKIQTIYKRDPDNKFRTLLDGDFSIPEFDYLKHNDWVFTEKVDGMNIRVMWDGEKVSIGGKTDRSQIPSELEARLVSMFVMNAARFLHQLGSDDVCFYGEGYGAKIQKGGGNYGSVQDFVLFDIKVGDWWLQRDDVVDIANTFDVDVVPIIGEGTLDDMVAMTRDGFKSRWGNFLAEGIVARPKTELKTRGGGRIITKIKCKDFQ